MAPKTTFTTPMLHSNVPRFCVLFSVLAGIVGCSDDQMNGDEMNGDPQTTSDRRADADAGAEVDEGNNQDGGSVEGPHAVREDAASSGGDQAARDASSATADTSTSTSADGFTSSAEEAASAGETATGLDAATTGDTFPAGCNGKATCTLEAHGAITYPLRRRGGVCYLGEIPIHADGTILENEFPTTWSAVGEQVAFCAGTDCLTCTIVEEPVVTEPYCSGSASSCSSRSAGSCVDGCDFRSRVVADVGGGTHSEFYCAGNPDPCADYQTQPRCDDAMGCEWYSGPDSYTVDSLESELQGKPSLVEQLPGFDPRVGFDALTDVVEISATEYTTCARLADGRVACWGDSGVPAAKIVPGITNAVSIGGSCAAFADGHVACWGAATPPRYVEGLDSVERLWANLSSVCAIRTGGGAVCWENDEEQDFQLETEMPTATSLIAYSEDFSCVGTTSGDFACFGYNEYCQLGTEYCEYNTFLGRSEAFERDLPAAALDLPVKSVAVDDIEYTTCVVEREGHVSCWGNFSGLNKDSSEIPYRVPGLPPALAVGLAWRRGCALLEDGQVMCWGSNHLQTVTDSNLEVEPPTLIAGIDDATALTVGGSHACVIVGGGAVRCWGGNNHLQLGDGTSASHASASDVLLRPVDAPSESVELSAPASKVPLEGATLVATAANHACALLDDGTLRCWGDTYSDYANEAEEVRPVAGHIVDLELDGEMSVALRDDGSALCWGAGNHPLLSNGTAAPVECLTAGEADSVSIGYGTSCLIADGEARCAVDYDVFDVGAFINLSEPPTPAQQVAAGSSTLSVLSQGKVYSAGRYWIDYETYYQDYTELTNLPEIAAIDAADDLICALSVSGEVYCWNLGTDDATLVSGVSSVTQVSVGGSHVCALTDAGAVWCWGANYQGQCGDTTTIGEVAPRQVPLAESATHVSSGAASTCATLTSGRIQCWGEITGAGVFGSSAVPRFVVEP